VLKFTTTQKKANFLSKKINQEATYQNIKLNNHNRRIPQRRLSNGFTVFCTTPVATGCERANPYEC